MRTKTTIEPFTKWLLIAAAATIAFSVIVGCAGNDKPWGRGTLYLDQAEYCVDARRQCERDKRMPMGGGWPKDAPEPMSCGAVERDCPSDFPRKNPAE